MIMLVSVTKVSIQCSTYDILEATRQTGQNKMWGSKELIDYADNSMSDVNVTLCIILHMQPTSNETGHTKTKGAMTLYYTLSRQPVTLMRCS
jgi:hypothetical protein